MRSLFGFYSKSDVLQASRSRYLWSNWDGNLIGRHACPGRDVIQLTGNRLPVFNVQKGRVDYFASVVRSNDKRTRTAEMRRYLTRKDIIPLLRQQDFCFNLPSHPPKFVFMDSFSELVV